MLIDIRLPNINGKTERERLAQVESYLIQFATQLQMGLNQIDTMSASSLTPSVGSAAPSASNPSSSAERTFNSIKALIIKSADIVNAYYEEINKRLVGSYVAQSDFGEFREFTESQFSATSTNFQQTYTDIQEVVTFVDDTKTCIEGNLKTISDDVDTLGKDLDDTSTDINGKIDNVEKQLGSTVTSIKEITANIKSGLLSEGVYGIEVGQKVTIDGEEVYDKFARFTSDRLSFYDRNGSEVAYISDYKLHITDAEIKGTLKLGGYRIDTTKGLTFKWVGRG